MITYRPKSGRDSQTPNWRQNLAFNELMKAFGKPPTSPFLAINAINTVAQAVEIATSHVESLEAQGTQNLSNRDLKTLQSYYKHAERKALAEHCAAVQARDLDPFDDDAPAVTPHSQTFHDLAEKLRAVNREISHREHLRNLEDREER